MATFLALRRCSDMDLVTQLGGHRSAVIHLGVLRLALIARTSWNARLTSEIAGNTYRPGSQAGLTQAGGSGPAAIRLRQPGVPGRPQPGAKEESDE